MARDDYWTRRALADEAAAERLAQQAAGEMRRVYREQYEAVLREIEGLMAEIAEGSTPTRTQLWNYARWRRLEARLREFAGEASRRCEQKITDCLDEVFRTVIGAEVTDMTGAVWQASISPKAVLETAWSGTHYSTRIWHNTAAIAERVREDVTDMIVQGKGISQVRRKLMEDFSVAYADADRLVRTEAAYVRNQAALTRYRQNGRRKVRWITGKSDGRECAICRERDGKEYGIDAAPRLPAHPNCRCCYAPVVETGLTEEGKPDTIGLEDAEIFRGVGAKGLNYDIIDGRGDVYHYVEGTRIQNREVFAGYGVKTPLHEGVAEGLTAEFGGDVAKWQHVKGVGIIDDHGEEVRAEVHWFQEESVGQVKHFIKKWLE